MLKQYILTLLKQFKHLKLYKYNGSSDMFPFLTNHPQGTSSTSKTNSVGVMPETQQQRTD